LRLSLCVLCGLMPDVERRALLEHKGDENSLRVL
jgi:hypothetical protein